jgi:hypothetical protein
MYLHAYIQSKAAAQQIDISALMHACMHLHHRLVLCVRSIIVSFLHYRKHCCMLEMCAIDIAFVQVVDLLMLARRKL